MRLSLIRMFEYWHSTMKICDLCGIGLFTCISHGMKSDPDSTSQPPQRGDPQSEISMPRSSARQHPLQPWAEASARRRIDFNDAGYRAWRAWLHSSPHLVGKLAATQS